MEKNIQKYDITLLAAFSSLFYVILPILNKWTDNYVSSDMMFYIYFFMPGITFPLATSYFDTYHIKYRFLKIIGHLILSTALYFGVVLFSLALSDNGFLGFFIGAFLGSILYFGLTSLLLKKDFMWNKYYPFSVAFLSALAFFIFILINGDFFGLSIFLWSVINAGFINFCELKTQKEKQ